MQFAFNIWITQTRYNVVLEAMADTLTMRFLTLEGDNDLYTEYCRSIALITLYLHVRFFDGSIFKTWKCWYPDIKRSIWYKKIERMDFLVS